MIIKKKTGNAIKISRVAQRVSRWGWIGHWWRFKARYENFFHFPVIVSDHSTNWRTMWPSIVLSGHCRSILCVCEEFLKRRTTDAKGSSGTFEAFIAYEIVRRQNEKKRRFWVLLLCSTWTDCWDLVSNTIHIYTDHVTRFCQNYKRKSYRRHRILLYAACVSNTHFQ